MRKVIHQNFNAVDHFVIPQLTYLGAPMGTKPGQSYYRSAPDISDAVINESYILSQQDLTNWDERNAFTEEEYNALEIAQKLQLETLHSIKDDVAGCYTLHQSELAGLGLIDNIDRSHIHTLRLDNSSSNESRLFHVARIINFYEDNFKMKFGELDGQVYNLFLKEAGLDQLGLTNEVLEQYKDQAKALDHEIKINHFFSSFHKLCDLLPKNEQLLILLPAILQNVGDFQSMINTTQVATNEDIGLKLSVISNQLSVLALQYPKDSQERVAIQGFVSDVMEDWQRRFPLELEKSPPAIFNQAETEVSISEPSYNA
ncbi:MAG: hypothetical protein EP298_13450 [Gammaproteobacteria bacterium]|nr:MAG: hypothetical protein EP298_13450 [Gammaproteobacteria bacterium]UTW41716.1 hypothetical protein KFE69_09385 [bacterium SCSIO 12844]